MERTRPRLGLRHPTVVPTNFEPEAGGRERDDDRERDRDAERQGARGRDGTPERPSSSRPAADPR